MRTSTQAKGSNALVAVVDFFSQALSEAITGGEQSAATMTALAEQVKAQAIEARETAKVIHSALAWAESNKGKDRMQLSPEGDQLMHDIERYLKAMDDRSSMEPNE
jgi:hypothetical protein